MERCAGSHSAYHEVRVRGPLSFRDRVGSSRFSSVPHHKIKLSLLLDLTLLRTALTLLNQYTYDKKMDFIFTCKLYVISAF